MTFRQRLAIDMVIKTQILLGGMASLIAGKSGLTPELMREFISNVRDRLPENLGQAVASKGMAREGQEIQQLFNKLSASVRPDSQWCFSKREWGKLVIMVMPQVIDSNTALVMESNEPDVKPGDIITLDGHPPNCDPAALAQFTAPPAPELVDAEFLEPTK